MTITNGDSASTSRNRDVVDYGFEEIDEFMVDVEEYSDRSSRTPIDDHVDDETTISDPDYVEEATESFDENSEEDEFDAIVTRGRAKRKSLQSAKAKKNKKEKPTKSPSTRQNRTTRAASVRF